MFNPQFRLIPENTDKIISHQDLRDLFSHNLKFYDNPRSVAFLLDQYKAFSSLFNYKNYFEGMAGLGYPFYNVDYNGAEKIREFESFNRKISAKLYEDKTENPEGYLCAKCQVDNDLPDLKIFCDECDISKLKPREIFKLLPDIDVLLIIDEPSTETEKDIERICGATNFVQSDLSVSNSLERAKDTYISFESDSKKTKPFPIDLHVVGVKRLLEGLQEIRNGEINFELPTRVMWSGWKTEGIPLFFDFVFSLTFTNIKNEEILDSIKETWDFIRKSYTLQEFLGLVATLNPRAARLMKEKSIIETLIKRYEN